jgi:cytoplasmic iron level regulating protein YaaA (DUF328/UPF0246 family)
MGKLGDAKAAKFFGVKGETLAAARSDVARLAERPPALPAAERYTGVVMGHIDRPTLGPSARSWFDEHVCFVSGMHGLVAAADPTPPYRLKMSASVPGVGRLSSFWAPHLNRLVADHDVVVDLLTNEHRSPFHVEDHPGVWIRVDLSRADTKPAGHAGKAGKGLLVRHLAEVGPTSAAAVVEACRNGPWPVRVAGAPERPIVTVSIID